MGQPARDTPHVVVLAFNHTPAERLIRYAEALASRGVRVDMLVVDEDRRRNLLVDPRVRLHALVPVERRTPLRFTEWALLFHLPLGALARARRLAEATPATRPLAGAVAAVERGYQRVAYGVHGRLFLPVYRQLRPWLLSRPTRDSLRAIDLASAERIVAGDISAVSLAWRLARRYPDAMVTTGMDVAPYAHRPVLDDGGRPAGHWAAERARIAAVERGEPLPPDEPTESAEPAEPAPTG